MSYCFEGLGQSQLLVTLTLVHTLNGSETELRSPKKRYRVPSTFGRSEIRSFVLGEVRYYSKA